MTQLPITDCHGCGVCCLHMGYPAFNLSDAQLLGSQEVNPATLSPTAKADWDRWNAMPAALRVEVQRSIKNQSPLTDDALDGECIWLDPGSRLCQHHEHRPQVCRDFKIGAKGCREWRAAYGV